MVYLVPENIHFTSTKILTRMKTNLKMPFIQDLYFVLVKSDLSCVTVYY